MNSIVANIVNVSVKSYFDAKCKQNHGCGFVYDNDRDVSCFVVILEKEKDKNE